MAYKGVIEDFQAIRRFKMPKRVPCTGASEEFDVKWHGKYTYEEFCQDGNKIFEVYKAAIEHFDYDWAWVQIDDCFEFEPIGVGVKGEGNILRATYKYLPANRDTLFGVRKMDPLRDGRMPEKLKALEKLKAFFGDTVLVTGSCAAPFSAIGLMWGIDESMTLMLTDGDLLHDGMECWKDFYIKYVKAQKDAGADAIWLGDCNAFSSMVPVDLYNEHILPVTKKLIEYCEKELDIMMWLHNSEIQVDHVRSHMPLGYSFENIGPDADIREIREATKGKVPISGNIDPIKVLWQGTPELVESEVERIMNTCKDGGGFIFSSGEMIPRQTPEENMLAMTRTVKRLAAY
jgi:[methyl-Co(III) methylamine-specific corrinoid protein]:coenzyme M methyltransferase